jgi:hypothetical protein
MNESKISPYLSLNDQLSKKDRIKLSHTQTQIIKKTQQRFISINFDFLDKIAKNYDESKTDHRLENNDEFLQYSDRILSVNSPKSIFEKNKYNIVNKIEFNKAKNIRNKAHHFNSDAYNPRINLSNTTKKENILSHLRNNDNFKSYKNKFLTKENEKLKNQSPTLNLTYSNFATEKQKKYKGLKFFQPNLSRSIIARKCTNITSQDSSIIKRKNSLHNQNYETILPSEEKVKKENEEKNDEEIFNKKTVFNPSGTSFFPKLSQKIFNYKLLKMPFGKHKIIPNMGTETMIFQKIKAKAKKKKIRTAENDLDLFYKH